MTNDDIRIAVAAARNWSDFYSIDVQGNGDPHGTPAQCLLAGIYNAEWMIEEGKLDANDDAAVRHIVIADLDNMHPDLVA